jgi:hypothetical protein
MHKVKQLLRESNFTTGDRFSTVWGLVLGNWVTDEVSTEEDFVVCKTYLVCLTQFNLLKEELPS